MPGWALGNVVIGIGLGLLFAFVRKMTAGRAAEEVFSEEKKTGKGRAFRLFLWAGAAVIVVALTAAGILGVKSITESLLYAQPFAVRVLKNMNAFIADAAVLLAALPLVVVFGPKLARAEKKERSLHPAK